MPTPFVVPSTGHTYAARTASETLHQTSSALLILAHAIEDTEEQQAGVRYNLWADTLRVFGRSLHHEGMLVDRWLRAPRASVLNNLPSPDAVPVPHEHDTPIAALARAYEATHATLTAHDVGGSAREAVGTARAREILDEAAVAMGKHAADACVLPATTLSDAMFQLVAAFMQLELLGHDADAAELQRHQSILTGIASVLHVLAETVSASQPPGLAAARHAVSLHWKDAPALVHQVSPASTAPDADAELIALCAELVTIAQALDDAGDDEATSGPLYKREAKLHERLRTLHATTPAGIVVRLQALAALNGDFGYTFDKREEVSGRELDAVMQDAVRLGTPKPTNPDAALIAACQDYTAAEQRYQARSCAPETRDIDLSEDPEAEAALADMGPALDRMRELRARSPAGIFARARALKISRVDGGSFEPDGELGRQLDYLLRDVAEIGGSAAPDGPDRPDGAGSASPFGPAAPTSEQLAGWTADLRAMDNPDLGTRLRDARLAKGWTPEQLAMESGITIDGATFGAELVERMEQGAHTIPTRWFEKVARACGVSLAWVLEGKEPRDAGTDIMAEAAIMADVSPREIGTFEQTHAASNRAMDAHDKLIEATPTTLAECFVVLLAVVGDMAEEGPDSELSAESLRHRRGFQRAFRAMERHVGMTIEAAVSDWFGSVFDPAWPHSNSLPQLRLSMRDGVASERQQRQKDHSHRGVS